MSPTPLGAFERSPLGAFYRSPLGARGQKSTAPQPGEQLTSGFVIFFAGPDDRRVTEGAGCSITEVFEAGSTPFYHQFQFGTIDEAKLAYPQWPSAIIIGRTSGFSWSFGGSINCDSYAPPEERVRAGSGALLSIDVGGDWLYGVTDGTPLGFTQNEFCDCFAPA